MAQTISPAAQFEVGEYATFCIGSDYEAVEVVEVSKTGHKVVTRNLSSMTVAGSDMGGDRVYVLVSDPNGGMLEFTRRKNGRYVLKGCSDVRPPLLAKGVRDYRDPSF